jgi:uncharacterized membrane protein
MKTLRSKKTKQIKSLIAFGWLVVTASPILAVDYSFSDLGGLSDLANPTFYHGINNHGHLVGGQFYSAGGSLAVQWNGSTWTPLANLAGSSDSDASGINDSGQVVGKSPPTGVDAATPVRWDNGVPTQLNSLVPTPSDFAAATSNKGQVFGMYWNGSALRPRTWAAGGMELTELPPLGGSSGYKWFNGINEAGEMVATTNTTGDNALHATAFINGDAFDLGTLEGSNIEAASINNSGQILGVANDTPRPVIWNDYLIAPTKLGTLGCAGGMAIAINDNSLIAGWSETTDGASHLTPWDHSQFIDLNQFIPVELVAAGWHRIQKGKNNSGLNSECLAINTSCVNVTNLWDNTDHVITII